MTKAESEAGALLAGADYPGALEAMAQMKPMIDSFFDSVLVMDPDELVKRNRLALLTRTRAFFDRMADFRKIQTS